MEEIMNAQAPTAASQTKLSPAEMMKRRNRRFEALQTSPKSCGPKSLNRAAHSERDLEEAS
jgi:hypothetical protein